MHRPRSRRLVGSAATIVAIVGIAALDFASGVELRIFPLYFVPISFAASRAGRAWTLATALACSAAWLLSNLLAGLTYSEPIVLAANFVTQAAAFVIVGALMSGMRDAEVRERDRSHTDDLTALPNRRRFQTEAERALASCRRYRRPLSVAFVDVDDFKRINDTRGHRGGDEVLCTIAAVLQRSVRLGDCVARMGGDEFAVLMPETGTAGAHAFAQRLRGELDTELSRSRAGATISVGAVAFECAPDDVETLLGEADRVMYAVKRAGKNGLQVTTIAPLDTAAG